MAMRMAGDGVEGRSRRPRPGPASIPAAPAASRTAPAAWHSAAPSANAHPCTAGRQGILRGEMPIYEYLCENGHRFEVLQRMSDDPVATCQVCAAPVQRVLHPVAIHFKGSGFYTTDYGRGKGAKTDAGKEAAASSAGGS